MIKTVFCGVLLTLIAISVNAQDPKDIIRKSEQKLQGTSNQAEITMTIIRPDWSREMTMKSWSKGNELSMILVTSPARDRGTSFLKRSKEMWSWQASIERVIKLPPSMMMQSWMGSDFTNDDLVKESSTIEDYTHKLLTDSTIEGRLCYKIELLPKEDAPVVWGKMLMWIDKKDNMQLMSKMYDEEGYLVNTMYGSNIKEIGGRVLPTKLEMIPEEDEGHKTIIEYKWIKFDIDITDDFFSVQNMKRLR